VRAVLAGIVAASLLACGHSDEEMAAVQRDIDKARADLVAARERNAQDREALAGLGEVATAPTEATTTPPPPPRVPDTQVAQPGPVATTRPAPLPALLSTTPQPANYAILIGIERYRDVPAATGAASDAQHMTQIMKQTLGLPESHVQALYDDHATRGDILGALDWLAQSVSAGSRVYFYFSGHGAPNASDQSAYLLPYEGNAHNIGQTGIPIDVVMRRLGATRAREVLAMFDSCFSGAGGRSVLPDGARPLMRVREAQPAAQMAVFTASGGDEISGPALGESGGVFTKYVTTGLGSGRADINGDGQVSLQELSDWVGPRVAQDAKRDGRDQHPHLTMGSSAGDAATFVVEYGLPTN
jgi:hypothetical protein